MESANRVEYIKKLREKAGVNFRIARTLKLKSDEFCRLYDGEWGIKKV